MDLRCEYFWENVDKGFYIEMGYASFTAAASGCNDRIIGVRWVLRGLIP